MPFSDTQVCLRREYFVYRPKIIVFALRKENAMEIFSPPTGMLEPFSIVRFFQNDDVTKRKQCNGVIFSFVRKTIFPARNKSIETTEFFLVSVVKSLVRRLVFGKTIWSRHNL